MDAVEEIALGELTEADLASISSPSESVVRRSSGQKPHRGLHLSLALSAGIHLLLASLVFYFVADELRSDVRNIPELLSVQFLQARPSPAETEQTPKQDISEDSAAVLAPIPDASIQQDEPVVVENSASQPEPPRLETADADVGEDKLDGAEVTRPANVSNGAEPFSLPNVESVLSAIDTAQRSDSSQFYSYDCNKIEEMKAFNRCKDQDRRNYRAVTKNPVYDLFNPDVFVSRSRESVTTLAEQSARVSAALDLGDLPSGLSAYLLEEVEQGIETYSNNSNRAINHMNTMLDKSAAGEQARRVFDHWVVQQSARLRSRRVENRQDAAREEKCPEYQAFIMAASELAKCLEPGGSALEFEIGF